MALKDWKKASEYPYKIEWEKKDKSLLKIQEEKNYQTNDTYWDVRYAKGDDYFMSYDVISSFKSKSQALSYAKAYMRKN